MLIRAFLLMQSAWSTLRQRLGLSHANVDLDNYAIRMEHAEAKLVPAYEIGFFEYAIRMEHAEAKCVYWRYF